jgi:hypothetical protein
MQEVHVIWKVRGDELDEPAEESSAFETWGNDDGELRPVAYHPAIPLDTFHFIVTDECHWSIYGLWRQLLEYFDAHRIGLTATPSSPTLGFFKQNLVAEYPDEQSVADGVNVGFEAFRNRTLISEHTAVQGTRITTSRSAIAASVSLHVAVVRPVDQSLWPFYLARNARKQLLLKDAYGAGKSGLSLEDMKCRLGELRRFDRGPSCAVCWDSIPTDAQPGSGRLRSG